MAAKLSSTMPKRCQYRAGDVQERSCLPKLAFAHGHDCLFKGDQGRLEEHPSLGVTVPGFCQTAAFASCLPFQPENLQLEKVSSAGKQTLRHLEDS